MTESRAAEAAEDLAKAAQDYLANETRLRAAIRAAAEAGVSEREITRRAPYSRMTVRKILADG